MKNCCLRLLLTISCLVLMQAATSALPLPQGSTERPANTARDQERVSTHAGDRSVVRRRASRISAGPGSQTESVRVAPARSWNQAGPTRSGVVAPQVQNKSAGRPLAVPPSVAHGNNVRHRGSNPAVVGGPASSNTRNVGALNGTSMKRP